MLWLIITTVVIVVGFYVYFLSKKPKPQPVLTDHNQAHNHKNGHGCCR
ncbi:MAG: hypothetical protein IPM56_04260 [Ignavibacteriales bacterium]|nr:MAG: hypothetical protein IPM56_04260 [Ignavibacteriales bacterium]